MKHMAIYGLALMMALIFVSSSALAYDEHADVYELTNFAPGGVEHNNTNTNNSMMVEEVGLNWHSLRVDVIYNASYTEYYNGKYWVWVRCFVDIFQDGVGLVYKSPYYYPLDGWANVPYNATHDIAPIYAYPGLLVLETNYTIYVGMSYREDHTDTWKNCGYFLCYVEGVPEDDEPVTYGEMMTNTLGGIGALICVVGPGYLWYINKHEGTIYAMGIGMVVMLIGFVFMWTFLLGG